MGQRKRKGRTATKSTQLLHTEGQTARMSSGAVYLPSCTYTNRDKTQVCLHLLLLVVWWHDCNQKRFYLNLFGPGTAAGRNLVLQVFWMQTTVFMMFFMVNAFIGRFYYAEYHSLWLHMCFLDWLWSSAVVESSWKQELQFGQLQIQAFVYTWLK